MSRFVSADDADYASLEDQLLKPSSVNDQPHSPQQRAEGEAGAGAVSYTHLTLPTIYSV